jgi:hypothetical protein
MEAMDVLRPLAFGELALGPRKGEVELAVQGLLRRRHSPSFAALPRSPPWRSNGAGKPGIEQYSSDDAGLYDAAFLLDPDGIKF